MTDQKDEQITYFAETNFRNERKRFGIKRYDRRRHFYIIGKTGMGKTTLLENLAIQDIRNGEGLAVIDPHGEFAQKMIDYVPSTRINDIVFFNPADLNYPIAFNVVEKVSQDDRSMIASGLMGVFKKIWPDVWSARMEYILNNSVLALLEYPGATLLGINRMLANKDYRQRVVDNVTDSAVKSFWLNEFAKYPDRFREEAVAPIQNKVGQFISSPLIRNIIGQTQSTINMKEIMNQGKILIVDLSKGRIGEDASQLLGALMITKLQQAAMSRVDMAESERKDFYLYVDEFQNFATDSFATILSEARKYRLNLILAHQYVGQLITDTNTKVRDAIFGNVGTVLSFRVGAPDAEFLETDFQPEFSINDLVNLSFAQIYLKLTINGVTSRPFSASTLPPFPMDQESYREKIIRISRERYGTDKVVVEEKIARWSQVVSEKGIKEGQAPISLERQAQKIRSEAVCSNCGQKTQVSFKPDGKRPVYCKECLDKRTRGEIIGPKTGIKVRPASNRPIVKTEIKTLESGEKPVSLKSFVKKEAKAVPERKRKEVNIGDLRGALADALGDALVELLDDPAGAKRGELKVEEKKEPPAESDGDLTSGQVINL